MEPRPTGKCSFAWPFPSPNFRVEWTGSAVWNSFIRRNFFSGLRTTPKYRSESGHRLVGCAEVIFCSFGYFKTTPNQCHRIHGTSVFRAMSIIYLFFLFIYFFWLIGRLLWTVLWTQWFIPARKCKSTTQYHNGYRPVRFTFLKYIHPFFTAVFHCSQFSIP